MDCSENRKLVSTRRALLIGGASFAAWAYMPKFAFARMSGQDPRLIVVILRGALDGLATVAPLGDPDYARLHGSIALSASGANAALPLDSFFSLHPAMPTFARLYKEKNATVVHATASTPAAWARASTISTPGMIGRPGKCPWKKGSLMVTALIAVMRSSGTKSWTRSTSSIG